MEVEGQPVAVREAGVDRALDRRAAGDPAARWHIDRQFRPVGCIDAEPADDEIALHHRINLSIGAIKRREHERPAAQAFRLTHRRHGDVEALAGLGKGRQFGGDHHRCGVLQRRVHPRRQRQAKARDRALHAQRRIVEAVVAGAREPDDDPVAGELVGAQALELAHVLDPLGMRRRREGETGEQERDKDEQGRTLGHWRILFRTG
jgi:hypothetical protein